MLKAWILVLDSAFLEINPWRSPPLMETKMLRWPSDTTYSDPAVIRET